MKIQIYDKWHVRPQNYSSPVTTTNISPVATINLAKSHKPSITYAMQKLNQEHRTTKAFLVRLVDKTDGYVDELIGDIDECEGFIKDCLSDLGIIKEKRGRTKREEM